MANHIEEGTSYWLGRAALKYREPCRVHATAEIVGQPSGVRNACVTELSIGGCYLAMPDPFSKGVLITIKIRTRNQFFECKAVVVHSTFGIGMGVEFREVSPPFVIVLQEWLFSARHESRVELSS
jgi:hypothetical protein